MVVASLAPVVQPASPSRSYLLVFEAGTASLMPLAASGELVLGQKQALLRMTDQGVVLQDLGSVQGTFLNGERVTEPQPLCSGDTIVLGALTLAFQCDPSGPQERAVLSSAQLRRRLEEEVERSVRYQRPLALLVVQLAGRAGTLPAAVMQAITGALRLVDIVGWGGRGEVVVLLPETGEAALIPSQRVLTALSELAPEARAGLAQCPSDGWQAGALLSSARQAAQSAAAGSVLRASEAVSALRVGEQTLVAADPAMKRLFALLRHLAASPLPVLITGETGVGKEMVALALHSWSSRSEKRLLSLNCAAVPDTLLESELFGYERGAFSGAMGAKAGLIEAAAGGTLFLDEIGESSPRAQSSLLRVLETKRFTRLGAVQERSADVRVLAATNRDLQVEMKAGRFRADLYYRLSAACLHVPALRERPADLAPLAHSLLEKACAQLGRAPMGLSPAALDVLLRYRWPGNVRELKNLMEYVAATVQTPRIEPGHLPAHLLQGEKEPSPEPEPTAACAAAQLCPAPRTFRNIHEELEELERTRMQQALEQAGGVRVRAAALIGMPLRTFVTKSKAYGLSSCPRSGRGSRAGD